ncbi:hypothetical protein DBZ36_02335 [Alginatibacterium sediminis]|uniref:Flagellin N-terminal domain-containing protein n=1 Tax=Alginatibacterium sediminis TaxID=2164068 RepID=A0A420ELL9_9ALTE|nr:hypothetical protein [Alginatibacterium sediminis]RKF21506.1 hypothetical protein DBZ36_02335 [Alginatibacterium sediminis]
MITNNVNSSSNSFYLDQVQKKQEEQDEQLASGKRVNKASIDPAALQIGNRLSSEINADEAYSQIYQNQIGQNNIQSAQLQSDTELLQQNQSLAIQAGNGIYNDDDLAALQAQADANTEGLSDPSAVAGVDITSPGAGDAYAAAQQTSDGLQAQLGAQSNVAESAIRSAQAAIEAQSAARSRLLDTNYAQASSQQSQNQALFESSILSSQKQREQAAGTLNNIV